MIHTCCFNMRLWLKAYLAINAFKLVIETYGMFALSCLKIETLIDVQLAESKHKKLTIFIQKYVNFVFILILIAGNVVYFEQDS